MGQTSMEEYTAPVQWMDAFLAEFREQHHREPTRACTLLAITTTGPMATALALVGN